MLKGKIAAATKLEDVKGKTIAPLKKGDVVQILERRPDARYRIVAGAKSGFVKGASLDIDFAGETIPPEAEASDLRKEGTNDIGPEGWFAVRATFQGDVGPKNSGVMTVSDFVTTNPAKLNNVPPSKVRVLKASSANEGNFEAINAYDNAFLSPGILQWTVGTKSGEGELAGLLDRLKALDFATFNAYFGKYGLDVEMKPAVPGAVRTGYLVLDGKKLGTPAAKNKMREPLWVYRFWRAAHDNTYRLAQFLHAVGRIDVFYTRALPKPPGLTLKDFITSEYGVALLLDQHVNRPGHVPKTVLTAIKGHPKKDPKTWTSDDERAVIKAYLKERAATNMTHSDQRATAIAKAVERGELSDERGSYT
jgi:hypothetical protein